MPEIASAFPEFRHLSIPEFAPAIPAYRPSLDIKKAGQRGPAFRSDSAPRGVARCLLGTSSIRRPSWLP
jgi:hypothetical protein